MTVFLEVKRLLSHEDDPQFVTFVCYVWRCCDHRSPYKICITCNATDSVKIAWFNLPNNALHANCKLT